MEINEIKRINSCFLPTPIERLNNVSEKYNIDLFMKRDDLTGHCFGGNKERKLEYIIADAVDKNATVIVTVGTLQSNHSRMTTSFANKLGLKTELIAIQKENIKSKDEGNELICKMLGAKVHTVKVDEVKEKIKSVIKNLNDKGEKPYFIEGGGHNILGTIAYINVIKELKNQLEDFEIKPSHIFLPVGTGTTLAGLILGCKIYDLDIKIIGISIARKKEKCLDEIKNVIKDTEKFLDLKPSKYDINIYDEYVGKGYGIPTDDSKKISKIFANLEGIIIDPIYNSKAISAMMDIVSKENIKGSIIYLNTGGSPNIFTKIGEKK